MLAITWQYVGWRHHNEQVGDGELGEKDRRNWEHKGAEEEPDAELPVLLPEAMAHMNTSPSLGHAPKAAGVCVDIHVPCFHQRPCGCPWSGLLLPAEALGRASPALAWQ